MSVSIPISTPPVLAGARCREVRGGGSSRRFLFRALLAALLVVLPGTLRAALNPTWNLPTDVPVTANGYTAGGNSLGTITLGFAPPACVLKVVNNTGSGAISGTFTGLAEGGTVSASYGGDTFTFAISYVGGDGNDITLTRVAGPGQTATGTVYAWANLAGLPGGVGNGDGTGGSALFNNPYGAAVDASGNVYVADS